MLIFTVILNALADQADHGGSGLAPLLVAEIGAVIIAVIGGAATIIAARSKPPPDAAAANPPRAASALDQQAAVGVQYAMTELEKALERSTVRAETAEARLEAAHLRIDELQQQLRDQQR